MVGSKPFHLVLFSLLSWIFQSLPTWSTTSQSLSSTDDYYTSVSIDIGKPSQSFDVLLDTINTITWVFDSSTNITSSQSSFNESKSSSWVSINQNFTYSYYNTTVNGSYGTDTLQISSVNISSQTVGLSGYDKALFREQELDGALSVAPNSTVLSNMKSQDETDAATITIDVDSSKLYLGTYSGSYTNSTNVSVDTTISKLSDYWTFEIDAMYYGTGTTLFSCSPCYGVIDSASPYLTFSTSWSQFSSQVWDSIGGGYCNYTTLECSSTDDMQDYIYFTINNTNYYIYQSDFYNNDKLLLQYTQETSGLSTGSVIYFGRPFLETIVVELNSDDNIMTFNYAKSSSNSSDKWLTVWITLAAVVVFAAVFFGVFCWYNKMPPPNQQPHEEQSLLHAPPHPGPQQHQPLGPAPSNPQPQPTAAPIREPAQATGSSTGARRSNDPDELRRRRLEFIAQQEQQEQQEQETQEQ